jgi:hypothetical protein
VISYGAPTAWSQRHRGEKPYALIFGTVYGPNDRPVYGVRVKIRRADQKKARWELTSDHHGEFAQRVPAGAADYIVWIDQNSKNSRKIEEEQARAAGGKAADRTMVTVHVQNDEREDISLHLDK